MWKSVGLTDPASLPVRSRGARVRRRLGERRLASCRLSAEQAPMINEPSSQTSCCNQGMN
jgi:hypothetical protein